MAKNARTDFIIRVLIPTALMAAALWYYGSLWNARQRQQNLILIEPVVLIMIPFYFAALYFEVRRYRALLAEAVANPVSEPVDENARKAAAEQAVFMAVAVASVPAFYLLGAIPATILLIVAGLLALGVRRPLPLIITPLVTTLALWLVFIELFAIRMPLFPGSQ